MSKLPDYFALLELGAPHFVLDEALLMRSYQAQQRLYHPDRVMQLPDAEKREALERSLQVNQAYKILRYPLTRALYLLEQAGISLDAQGPGKYVVPADLLEKIFVLREQVADANPTEKLALKATIVAAIQHARQAFAESYAIANWEDAAYQLTWWRYLEKAEQELKS